MPGCTRECLLSLICALSFALIDCFDIGISTKCVSVPKEMGLCQDVGYTEMRLPNLMGHTTLREVIPKSAEWESLLRTGCHTHSATFLCSLFAPVCLDTFLQPCRSLCVAVRDSCSQVLTCHGQSWPDAFDCDRFPADEDTCLTSISTESSTYRKYKAKLMAIFADRDLKVLVGSKVQRKADPSNKNQPTRPRHQSLSA
ncbi:secreted frizzled-related protein 2-like [Rhincodon typus]|uniref:secreted frizzled-related protein 2-like n=1 Tax=Rhincodon typus TaxID=259920 RepID=UPI00202F8DEC|nr:secreted frizzled-related protein 2-like [Rhincodon typus]